MRPKFDSVRFRLLLLIAVVLVVTVGTAALFVSRAITERFQQYLIYREAAGVERRQQLEVLLPDLLAAYYAHNAGWEGIPETMTTLGAVSGERLLLVDAQGSLLVDSAGLLRGPADSAAVTGTQRPILWDQQLVGTLWVAPMEVAANSSSENAFIASANQSLLWALLTAGSVALFLTLAISRRILGPVEALTAAARRMERGDLNQRVPVTSTDEIGALAHAFNAMADSLARAEQLRRNMVTDVAHELRTPLSNIRGYLEALQDQIVSPTPALIDSLYEEAMLLSRLVADLQELALVEAGQLKLELQQVAIGEIVERAVQVVRHPPNGSRLTLRVQVPAALPQAIGDPERIGQILRNLLANAYAYTPAGGEVIVSAQVSGSELQVEVRNSGSGIEPEHLPYLFERFYRADRSRSRATGGSGLGLAIVKQLVEAHGGRVWAENTPGVGACFVFTLPVAEPTLHIS